MKLNIYCIKDTVVGEYESPFYMKNNGTAMRACSDAINAGKIANAKDKQLYILGEFNTETGEIVSDVKFVCNLADFVSKVGENA